MVVQVDFPLRVGVEETHSIPLCQQLVVVVEEMHCYELEVEVVVASYFPFCWVEVAHCCLVHVGREEGEGYYGHCSWEVLYLMMGEEAY